MVKFSAFPVPKWAAARTFRRMIGRFFLASFPSLSRARASQITHPLMHVGLRAAFSVAIALLPCSASSAQDVQAPSPDATLHVTRRLVVLDAEIVDRHTGAPVHGLTASDVHVFEDGQPRHVDALEEHVVDSSAANPGNRWIFLLDALNTPLEEATYAEKSFRSLLEKQPETFAEPSTLLVLDDRGLHTLAPLTRSRSELLSGLRSYKPVIPFTLSRGDSDHLIVASLYTLRQLAIANMGTPGRSFVFWIGRAFPSIVFNTIPQETAERLNSILENLTTNLLDARVTVTRVDTATAGNAGPTPENTDLDATFDTSPEPFADSFSFGSLIEQTGGQILYNRNDLDNQVAEVANRSQSYYTVAYTPSPTVDAADSYRHIRLVVDRKGVSVQTRRGYFARPVELKALSGDTVRVTLNAAILNQLAYTGLNLSMVTESSSGGHHSVGLLASVPPGVAEPGTTLTFVVAVARYDAHDKPLSYTQTQEQRPVPSGGEPHVALSAPADGAGMAHRVRIVVLEPLSGQLGSLDLTGAALQSLQK